MTRRATVFGLAVLAVVAFWSLPTRAAEEDAATELAARCEAIEWRVPFDWSDTVPPALRAIQRELQAGESVEHVIAALPRSLHLRRIAPQVLAQRPSDDTRAALVRLLSDSDAQVAAPAAFALGEVGGKEVQPALLEAAATGDPGVRHTALNALGQLGAADRAFDVALECMDSDSAGVRHSAVDLLSELRGATHMEIAMRALEQYHEPDEGVRAAIAVTLRVLRARRE